MKHTKFAAFAAGLLITATLASCGGGGGGEKEAIQKAIDGTLVTQTSSGTPIQPNTLFDLNADDNDSVTVTTSIIKKINGTNYTVTLSWSWDETYSSRIKLADLDETHKKLEFTYPYSGQDPVTVEFSASLKCGNETGSAKYTVKLNASEIIFDTITLKELYALNDKGDNFKFVNDEGGIKGNHGQNFYYIITSGKLVYKSPDENWGLLADGDHWIQLYQIGKCSDREKAVVGDYLTIYGEVGKGYGNIQLSYINKIEKLEDHSKITDPVEFGNIPGGINDGTSEDFKTFYSGISNRRGELVGTMNETVTQDIATAKRFTFGVNVDGKELKVAFDYHIRSDEITTAYNNFFKAATKGTQVSIKGSLRWCSNEDSASAPIGPNGTWQLVPYLTTDLATK